tara:strand:- start:484 stop:1137 length:654 start_codon:yes stop_codon:yes gene_type:complete
VLRNRKGFVLGIVDSGIANIGSVKRAFQRLGVEATLLSSGRDLKNADAVVLPGVGSFADGMASLREKDFVQPLKDHSAAGKPMIGLCLGMQLLADASEENGWSQGLGIIRGEVKKLEPTGSERVPNIGWCDVTPTVGGRLFEGFPAETPVYFVHSYHLVCNDPTVTAATISFGGTEVTAAIERESVFGLQGHPEKSQDAGLHILDNFVNLSLKSVTV